MDPVKIEKIQAIKKYNRHQLLNHLFLYSTIALTCSLFCSNPIWIPCLSSLIKVFLFVSLPEIVSLILSSKFAFIAGNLIIIVLVAESKIFSSYSSSSTSDVYYEEYVRRSQRPQNPITEEKKENEIDKSVTENVQGRWEGEEGIEEKGWIEGVIEVGSKGDSPDGHDEEFNRRADDFIARMNKQRKLELSLLCERY
ncbi:Transmembrane protein [Quillaja saponaria]|uniref:Transmembrane protein n=1 Tax=Quillaja saponaria TaxID=32244 RepID=A0AAD7KV56_QUISA|nr:Transmembrane protein [Quillaja saponaria]